MRIFVTGASGWIGGAVVPALISSGHEVVGLARSDAAASAIAGRGGSVVRGSIDDPRTVARGAAACDGVVHLAYHHDFSEMDRAAALDLAVIEALVEELEGSDRPLVIASGLLSTPSELDELDPRIPRSASGRVVVAAAERGVRGVVLRLPPTVHGTGDVGFVAMLIDIARARGASGYIDAGENCWSAVHVRDAGELFALAVEGAPAGAVLHAVQDEGVPFRDLAHAIGRHLDVPTVSIPSAEVVEHFGWMGFVASAGVRSSSARTRELLSWEPRGPRLLEDLEAGNYFAASAARAAGDPPGEAVRS